MLLMQKKYNQVKRVVKTTVVKNGKIEGMRVVLCILIIGCS